MSKLAILEDKKCEALSGGLRKIVAVAKGSAAYNNNFINNTDSFNDSFIQIGSTYTVPA